MLGDNVKKMWK